MGNNTFITPKLALLNIWEPTDLNRAQRTWVALALIIAKRNVARLWGTNTVPTLTEWEKNLDWCMLAEKVIYESRGCPKKWTKIWGEWNTYRGHLLGP